MKGSVINNVLILCPFFRPNIGGVETHLTDLTEYLRKKGYKVDVIACTPLTTDARNVPLRESYTNLEVHRLKWLGRGLFLKFEPYFMLEFIYLFLPLFIYTFIFLLRRRVDVIHAHGLIAACIATFMATLFKLKTVVSMHGIYNFNEKPVLALLSRPVLQSSGLILALSPRSEVDLTSIGVPRRKIRICTQWVDQSLFKPSDSRGRVRDKLGLNANDFVVLFVGRLLEKKGVGVLLQVADKLPSDIRVLFVGTGPMEKAVKKAEGRLTSVRLIGKVPVEVLADYYRASDLVILPSQYEEGFSRVILEALSCGTPVLAVDRGCPPEMIDESVGRLVNPTVRDVYRQVMYFYGHRNELMKLASNCRGYALSRYSERNAELIERAYMGEL